MNIEKGVSVIICCYNSSSRIRPTLRHLSGQKTGDNFPAEIILVDNNSTDDTAAIALEYWQASGSRLPFRVVNEPRQGLSNARQRGMQESRFGVVVFCDDDNWLDELFIRNAYALMDQHPDVVVAGGPVAGVYEADLPAWIRQYLPFYAVGTFDHEGDITDVRPFVPGAGLVVRKSAYQQIIENGFAFVCSDRKGSKLSSGGDTELCLALVLAGGRVYYSSSLALRHYIPAGRTTWEYARKLLSSIAAATVILDIYTRAVKNEKDNRYLVWKTVLDKMKYVLNPLQYIHYRKIKGEGVRDQLKYESSVAILKVNLLLLLQPGYYKKIKRQVARLRSIARPSGLKNNLSADEYCA